MTPDTILRWYRRLIAEKWTSEYRRPGRPGLMKGIAALIVRMATENPGWGYSRIQGALKNLDHRVARSTVALKERRGSISRWRRSIRRRLGRRRFAEVSLACRICQSYLHEKGVLALRRSA